MVFNIHIIDYLIANPYLSLHFAFSYLFNQKTNHFNDKVVGFFL